MHRYPKIPRFKTLYELVKYTDRKKWVNPNFQTRLKPLVKPKRWEPAYKNHQQEPRFLAKIRWKREQGFDFPSPEQIEALGGQVAQGAGNGL